DYRSLYIRFAASLCSPSLPSSKMSTPSTMEAQSTEEQEETELEDHFDSSSSHVHDSSKEGEGDESTAKPKRTRKSTQRFLETFMDEELSFAHKSKKKKPPHKRMDESGHSHSDNGDLLSDAHNEPSGSHESMVEESEKKTRVVPGKSHIQCTFMESKKKSNSQCKQRAIEGFLFCIWHILNDPQAPYKRCEHMRQVVKKDGVERRVQCKTAIKKSQNPPLCLAHSDNNRTKRKRKRESMPSPSSLTKGSPVVSVSLNKSSPSSPSSSIFNFRNEDFVLDIDEAIDNMGNMDDMFDTFDDFNSIDNLEEEEEEKKEMKKEEEEEGEKTVKTETNCEYEDDLSEYERELMNILVVPPFTMGQKLNQRMNKMRETFKSPIAFWKASALFPDVPYTVEKYSEQFVSEGQFEKINVPVARKEELRILLLDPEVREEIKLLHEYNMGLLREMTCMERTLLNWTGRHQ
ncbi:hypothetical protein PFISCL1PPCAC_10211, partial [Pristionchus fissidentatus]